jgi:BON domain
MAIDPGGAAIRRAGKRLYRGVHVRIAFARGHVHGLVHGLRRVPVRELDDARLVHMVESVLFRDARVPKGRISVNAEGGAVFLRGEVASPDLIEELEGAAGGIGGVRSVENLLHQPGTLAPHSRAAHCSTARRRLSMVRRDKRSADQRRAADHIFDLATAA